MKKILLFLSLLPFFSFAQVPSCCKISSTQAFARLAGDEQFALAHLAPLPFEFTPEKGKTISYPCEDGKTASAFVVKADTKTNAWLIVLHEWWGLNDYIRRESERLQSEIGNINVIALDLYDGKFAETPAVAQELMGGLDDKRARAIIKGAFQFVGENAKIQTIGWCMGGGWSLQTALMAGKQSAGCVMYYGMPEKDKDKLKTLNADILGIFASKDAWITPEIVTQFEKDMKASGKKLKVKSYPADHAFANPSNPKYDKVSAEAAHQVAVSFIKSHMK